MYTVKRNIQIIFLMAIFLLSIIMGLQVIVIPWLALDYFQLSASAIGIVQASVLIPNALFLLLGGISADRGAALRNFLWVLSLYGLAHGFLLLVLFQHWSSFLYLIFYALMVGCINAFIQPGKDYLVAFLAEGDLQSIIAKNNLVQYVGQSVGVGLASWLYAWQIVSVPVVQILLTVMVMFCFYFLITHHKAIFNQNIKDEKGGALSVGMIISGFEICWQSSVLRTVISITAVNGFFHIGTFIVSLPLLAKNIYVGDIKFYSLLQFLFLLGTVVTTLLVVFRRNLDAPGRRVIFNVLYAGLILLGLSVGPTTNGLMFLIFLWGVVVGISATLGKAIIQSQALQEYRGRVISIYQLALFGFAPLGALFAGWGAEQWGVLFILKISAIASFISFAATFLTRALWDIEAEDTSSTQ
jgi:MFS family permease